MTSMLSLKKRAFLPKNWQSRLPDNSSPYTSTIIFLVRKGNPKHIRDWDDLVRPGVAVISPNPKDLRRRPLELPGRLGLCLEEVRRSGKPGPGLRHRLYKNVPVLDSGARGATTTFVERGIGDVLIAWENESLAGRQGIRRGQVLKRLFPSITILCEPTVERGGRQVVDKKGTRALAEAYLQYLYSPEGQEIAAAHYYRPGLRPWPKIMPADSAGQALYPSRRPFGAGRKAQKTHFADGGVFDQIYQPDSQ